jgi:hypothetical protein
MENTVMFVIGVIIFTLYIVGYLFMVKRQNELQQKEIMYRNSQVRKNVLLETEGYTIGGSITRTKYKNRIVKKQQQ